MKAKITDYEPGWRELTELVKQREEVTIRFCGQGQGFAFFNENDELMEVCPKSSDTVKDALDEAIRCHNVDVELEDE